MQSLNSFSRTVNRFCRSYLRRTLTSTSAENAQVEEQKEKNILVDWYQGVAIIGINRPDKKNCLDGATIQEFLEELDKFENDEKSVVGVIHGIGGNFCSGYDLKEIAQYDGNNEETLPQFGPLADKIELSKKPLVAAIDGYAVGVGFEIALMCDLRVVDSTAVMGFLNRRFGIPILCGGTVRLPALIGYSRAMELILTGRGVNAQEAFNWGLANKITSAGAALGNALNFAKSCVKFPQRALLADRASAYYATFCAKQLEEALQFEKDNGSHIVFEDGVNGAKRFVAEGLGRHGKFYDITKIDDTIKEIDKEFL
ncbi:2,3-dehydroadipyl-CoA hydratase [Halictus rubicundus]|uniref:2,3-dehydroadipyl-CoA hydratase n=1 Tax=Halictus rubicundus TaxID=77578 RepID=UPI00403595AA